MRLRRRTHGDGNLTVSTLAGQSLRRGVRSHDPVYYQTRHNKISVGVGTVADKLIGIHIKMEPPSCTALLVGGSIAGSIGGGVLYWYTYPDNQSVPKIVPIVAGIMLVGGAVSAGIGWFDKTEKGCRGRT